MASGLGLNVSKTLFTITTSWITLNKCVLKTQQMFGMTVLIKETAGAPIMTLPTNIDCIGDTPYLIDENNQDNCRLMSLWSASTVEETPFWTQWWLWRIVVAKIIPIAGTVYFLKKSKS